MYIYIYIMCYTMYICVCIYIYIYIYFGGVGGLAGAGKKKPIDFRARQRLTAEPKRRM